MQENQKTAIPLSRMIFYLFLILLLGGMYFLPRVLSPQGKMSAQIPDKPIPVFMAFTSPECSVCTYLKPEFLKLAHEFEGKVAFVEVNVKDPSSRAMMSQYSVFALPSIYLLDSSHRVVAHYEGGVPPDALRENIKKLLEMEKSNRKQKSAS